jgi:hypothetical protein
MDQRTTGDRDAEERVSEHFPELDDAARRRAADRMAAGAEPHAAFAQESVMLQLMRAYN